MNIHFDRDLPDLLRRSFKLAEIEHSIELTNREENP